MLFNTNLEEIIFHRHQTVPSNELVILSGYLGPNPVARLATLPFNIMPLKSKTTKTLFLFPQS